jgi:transposase
VLIECCDEKISLEVGDTLAPLVVQLRSLGEAIARLDRALAKTAHKDDTTRRDREICAIFHLLICGGMIDGEGGGLRLFGG